MCIFWGARGVGEAEEYGKGERNNRETDISFITPEQHLKMLQSKRGGEPDQDKKPAGRSNKRPPDQHSWRSHSSNHN